jgi:NADP-dependent 3-hydroxy acid dehydrogenase YdfG
MAGSSDLVSELQMSLNAKHRRYRRRYLKSKVVLITGASSGFGRLTAEAVAKKGHVVYGSMRQTATRNASVVEQMAAFSRENQVDLRALELYASGFSSSP